MKLGLHANAADKSTWDISGTLLESFGKIENDLSKDYGGIMEHLWIDFELIRHWAERRPPYKFRFQKRVSGKGHLTGIDHPDQYNVGHYSVCPDFDLLLNLPSEKVAAYALHLIYDSTLVLLEKKKRLGGFDAERFRDDFLSSCETHGYSILENFDKYRPGFLSKLKRLSQRH